MGSPWRGLLIASLLTLFVIPAAYMIIHGVADRLNAWLTGGRPAEQPAKQPQPEPAAFEHVALER